MRTKHKIGTVPVFLVILLASVLLYGCGNAKKEAPASAATGVAEVGTDACKTCHQTTANGGANILTRDITMVNDPADTRTIFSAWTDSLHVTNPFEVVQCENCHGGGANHWGIGPLPYPVPQVASCAPSGATGCHETFGGFGTSFATTSHINSDSLPDPFFFQVSDGPDQAEYFGNPEFVVDEVTGDPTTEIVTKSEHIEQCSVCHNSNHKFRYNSEGGLTKPNPDNMPTPMVACANCHDGHQVAKNTPVTIPQRGTALPYPIFRKVKVDVNGANDPVSGTWTDLTNPYLRTMYQPNGAVQANGTINAAAVVNNNNEIYPDRICGSCHAKGKYKYSRVETHQEDIYAQWKDSGHGDRTAAAFGEFSANPPFYGFADTSHQVRYPYDMELTTAAAGGPATGTTNAGNNNYACYKCHHGIGSTAYLENVEGTADAPVLFGDATVTCITCHDPHGSDTGAEHNLRVPEVMSKYSSTQVTFSGNVFFDNTAVPATTGNATICIFCHQGRESGYTLFKRRIAGTVTGNFLNPHYLGTAAMLWARNGYEYAGKLYGEVTAHQQANCTGCHMASSAREDMGGHTWRIFAESDGAFNTTSCNTSACHNNRVPATRTDFFSFRDSVYDPTADYDGDSTAEGIPQEIQGLEDQLIALLQANGIYYLDTAYPYFFSDAGHTTGFTAWNGASLKAAFNLSFIIKGLPAGASQIGQPNPSAAAHNYRYNIQLLRDSYDTLCTAVPGNCAVDRSSQPRPTGTRAATNYNPQTGGGYDPLQ